MLREIISNDGYVYCSVLSLLILLIVKTLHNKRLTDFMGFLGNSNYLKIYIKEHSFFDVFDSLLFINFGVNTVAFYWIVAQCFFNAGHMTWITFFGLLGLISIAVLAKIGLQLLIGYAFDLRTIFNVLSFQQISSFNFVGILLLPVNAILVFGTNLDPKLIQLTTILMVLILLMGLTKTIQSNLSTITSNIFYFILYICTLEIAPYLVAYHILNQPKIF